MNFNGRCSDGTILAMIFRFFSLLLITSVFFLPLKVLAETGSGGISTKDERLLKAVQETKISLDDTAKTDIAAKCKNAQIVLKTLQDEADFTIRERITAYSGIQKDLQAIKLRMAKQGADASETDLLTGKIQQLLDEFTLQADKYGVALDDIISIDCAQKPEQFKAGLIMMRVERANLLQSADGLKKIIQNADNDIFNQLKKRLSI